MATARWLVLFLSVSAAWAASAAYGEEKWKGSGATVGGMVVEKERQRVVAASEAGTVTAADVADVAGTVYRLQFITMDPGSLFLPVELHADMVFYVHSGRGKVTYIQGGSEASTLQVERGDVYNLEQGTILYIQSYPNATRERLRIYAIFTGSAISSDDPSHPTSEAYSNVSNLLKGFEVEILRRGFGVPSEVVEPIKSAPSPPLIIPYNPKDKEEESSNWTEEIFDAFWGIRDPQSLNKKDKKDKDKKDKDKKSKDKTFNFYSGEPDVKNCHGWSKTMTNEDLQNLRESNIGMFMVNLTTGSMMGPHWNPKATEIAIVTHGSGIVQTVCPSSPASGKGKRGPGDEGAEEIKCKNSLFRVKEGDVFVVPRFHPMAQMSFNNDSFVFVGFSTHMGQNHPQFLAGKLSALQVIGKEILALSLGQENSTAVEKLLSAQSDSTILTCISCAEELEKKVEQEEQEREKREREEEERRKKEEEERARREEEERKRKEEEERARREEEERKKKEDEEKARKEEEERRREEEERARQEEEEKRRKEEEEKARKEEEEKRRREEEEKARQEEEERKRREKEEARKEEEERRQREEEERARREQEAEEEARREQEKEEKRRQEDERARREQEEEERRRQEEEGGGGGGDEPSEEEEGGRGREEEPREQEGGDWDWGDSQHYAAKKLKKRYSLRKGAVLQSA